MIRAMGRKERDENMQNDMENSGNKRTNQDIIAIIQEKCKRPLAGREYEEDEQKSYKGNRTCKN